MKCPAPSFLSKLTESAGEQKGQGKMFIHFCSHYRVGNGCWVQRNEGPEKIDLK